MPEPRLTRFRRSHPCPICGGGDDMPRGRGQRCSGYLSSDGRFAYCTRAEHAGRAAMEETDPPTYRHILEGECRCGVTHAPARADDEITYDYVDDAGALQFQVVRLPGKQFRQRRPDGHGGWLWQLGDTRRILYRSPALATARLAAEFDGRRTVYVVEGEKDVHAVERAGGIATCNPGGAGKWRSEYAEQLRGLDVVIVADRDEPGIRHAHAVAATLPASQTTIVQAKTGKDAADHLAAGHTLAEFVALDESNEAAVSSTIVIEPLREFLKRPLPKAEALVGAARAGTNLLPRYGWVMPWGREGSGKTSILIDLLFHAACGIKWLHYPVARPLRVVAIINEGVPGGLQDKLAQKAERWGGDSDAVLDNIAIYASPWGEFTFRDEAAVAHARSYALDFGADYVALDPLHTLGTSGAGAPQETEEFKHLLRAFGLWQDLGIITVHHSNKSGMVSGDWARHPDTVLRVEKDGQRPATKITIEKARPADPDELSVPQLLEWETETLSYRHVPLEAKERVSDSDLLQRIHATLAGATEPLRMSDLQRLVTGDDARISALTKAEIEAGRIANTPPRRGAYALSAPLLGAAPDTATTETAAADPKTSMDTGINSGAAPTPTSISNGNSPVSGVVGVGAPAPIGAPTTPTPTRGDDQSELQDEPTL